MRVLLVDDNPDDRALAERDLRQAFGDLEAIHVTDQDGLDRALTEGGFDLVVTDYQIRWTNGLAVLDAVKRRTPDAPVIMFTATGTEEVAVDAMKGGLDDYVIKTDRHRVRLPAAARSALANAARKVALRRSEERFRHVVEASSDWVWETDSAFRVSWVSDRFEHTYRRPGSILIGQSLPELAKAGPGVRAGGALRHVLDSREPFRDIEVWLDLPGVGLRLCRLSAMPLLDGNGRFDGYRGAGADTTSQRETEERAAMLQRRVAEAFEGVPVGLALFDASDRLVLVNQAARTIGGDIGSGMARPGMAYRDLVGLMVHRQAVKSVGGGEWQGIEDFIRRAGCTVGEPVDFQMANGCWIRALNSRTSEGGFVRVRMDVTEHVQRDQALLHMQKLDAVGRMTGGLAHDFNNMLTVILSNLDFVKEEVPPELRRAVEGAERAAMRAADLTARLLAFSRRSDLNPTLVDVADVLDGVARLIRPVFGETIRLTIDVPPDLPAIQVDRGQLENALVNLAVNSRDAMPGGGAVALTAAPTDSGQSVLIAVADTGIGMPPEVLAHAFEPFFTTKEKGKGTGLGLSGVYGFVRQSGGSVDVRSEVGKGTTINLTFPAAGRTARG